MASQPVKHGTRYSYRRRGCHCEECRRWNAEYMAEYRRRRLAKGHDKAAVYGNQNGTGWDRWPRNMMLER